MPLDTGTACTGSCSMAAKAPTRRLLFSHPSKAQSPDME